MHRRRMELEDGRWLYFYTFETFETFETVEAVEGPPESNADSEVVASPPVRESEEPGV